MKRALTRSLLILQSLSLALPLPSLAQWQLQGFNTFRIDSYNVDGDARQSPYREEGVYAYNDLNLSLAGTSAPGQSWRFDFAGTLTDSPYRSSDNGLVPEAMRGVYENKAAELPFRLDVGDQNVALSSMSLQRTLKAARVSLRPQSERDGRSYAVDVFAGVDGQSWRGLDLDQGLYRGLSLSIQDNELGTYGFNFVHYSGGDNDSIDQTVASVHGRRQFDVAGQDLALAAEWGVMHGDSATGAENTTAHGGFIELQGKAQNAPLSYRLRYDRYGEDFAPKGATISVDSEAYLAEANWRSESGTQLQGKLARVTERHSSANPISTDTASAAVTVPIDRGEPGRGSVRVQAQLQQRQDEAGLVETDSASLRASAVVQHDARRVTKLNASLAAVDDRKQEGTERISKQLVLSHALPFEFGGMDLVLTPGVSIAHSRSQEGSLTVGPTLAVEAVRERDRLTVQLGQSEFDSQNPLASFDETRLGVKYEMQRGQHRIGFDADRLLREPDEGESTDAWRAGIYWRYDFQKSSDTAG
jgi:hypothetical protein